MSDDDYPVRVIEPEAYAKFARRIIRSLGRRVAQADPYQLRHLIALRADVDTAIAVAVAGLRSGDEPYSWADIARPLGITRQGARQVYGPLCNATTNEGNN